MAAADSRRADRVAEAIRAEVATFLADGVKDPRVKAFVTVTGVDVTRDLRQARVYVSLMGADADRASTLEALDHLAPHLRSIIGKSLRLRAAPELEFRVDDSIAHAARIDSLLAQARESDAAI
ncbi:MAG: 30S ribosome-binding factor RbfA, partial [Gemmatimonadota bacterium]